MINLSKWIWIDPVFPKNEYCDFLHNIVLDKVDENAMFYISADSEYVLWLNGKFVNCGQYNDFPSEKVYDALPVGEYLKSGENVIAISAYYQGESSFQYSKGERGICFALVNHEHVFSSSKDVKCRISKVYQSGDIHKTTMQLGYGFEFNAIHDDEWIYGVTSDAEQWQASKEKTISTTLKKRPIKKLEIEQNVNSSVIAQGLYLRQESEGTAAKQVYRDYLSHRRFEELFSGKRDFPITNTSTEKGPMYLVVDLGEETCGYLSFCITAKEGTVIDIAYGEHLRDMRVRCEIVGRNFADTYICREGKQEFTYYFKRIAGRYIELHISNSDELTIDYVGIKKAMYPLEIKGRFVSSDSLHNKIFDVCINTLKLCMHEHYEDCPWREQALYGFDSRNQALFGYYAFAEYEFAKASLELLGKSIRDDGILHICAPTDEKLTIPSFSLMWIVELKEYTEFSNDLFFIENYWNVVEKMLSSSTKKMHEGLAFPPEGDLYWNFYEWTDLFNGHNPQQKELRKNTTFLDGVYNLILYLAIKSAVWLAEKSGDKVEFVNHYSEILKKMRISFNEIFWDDDEKIFAAYKSNDNIFGYGQLTQALALYTEICNEDRRGYLSDALVNRSDITEITLSYSVFKYEALLNYDEKYAGFVFDDIAKRWGNMIYSGATSFWETFGGSEDFYGAGSLCHGWSAIPLYMYLRYILGISPQGLKKPNYSVFPKFSGQAQIGDVVYTVSDGGKKENE